MKVFLLRQVSAARNVKRLIGLMIALAVAQWPLAQNKVDLSSLTFSEHPTSNWHIAGDVRADLNKNDVLIYSPGTGILVSQAEDGKHGSDLIFNTSHGDADLELDFMMAKKSNSGIYLQGEYEIQLLDSWDVVNPSSGDVGGIYERWNDAKPNGQQGFDGHAPRQNAGRAPGLWQHMKISFQAPRFDDLGTKTENAKITRVELNGVTIQENVELSGPTRGALNANEVAKGPLRIQGDHGPVAFRNIVLTSYDNPRPELVNLKYSVYKGKFDGTPDYKKLPPEAEGTSVILSANVSNIPNEFMLKYTGTLIVKKAGEYRFRLRPSGGIGNLKINNQVVIPFSKQQPATINLPVGDLPVEIEYSKYVNWAKPGLMLTVAGAGVRETLISDFNSIDGEQADPILVNAPVNTILRSFTDIDTFRVTHAVNVGSDRQVHYTYDLDNGMIVQVWRGGFLDATPMWHSRGDGSSRALGSVIQFGHPEPAIKMLSSENEAWTADTTGLGYRPKGYVLDDSSRPTFRYLLHDNMITDAIRVLPGNHGLHREITMQSPSNGMYMLLAKGATIENPEQGLFLVNDKTYYIQLDDAGASKPVIRNINGVKELIVPIQNKFSYSILY